MWQLYTSSLIELKSKPPAAQDTTALSGMEVPLGLCLEMVLALVKWWLTVGLRITKDSKAPISCQNSCAALVPLDLFISILFPNMRWHFKLLARARCGGAMPAPHKTSPLHLMRPSAAAASAYPSSPWQHFSLTARTHVPAAHCSQGSVAQQLFESWLQSCGISVHNGTRILLLRLVVRERCARRRGGRGMIARINSVSKET